MATYDLIERLNSTFREIEHELLTLTERLQTCRLLAARVFYPARGSQRGRARPAGHHRREAAHRQGRTGAGDETLSPSFYPAAV